MPHACPSSITWFPSGLLADRSIHRKRRGYGIGRVVPRAVESHAVVISSGGNGAVIAQVGHRHVRSALCFAAIPDLGYGLAVGEGPGQSPIRNGSRAGVVDGDGGTEAAWPLIGDRVVNVAGESARPGADG